MRDDMRCENVVVAFRSATQARTNALRIDVIFASEHARFNSARRDVSVAMRCKRVFRIALVVVRNRALCARCVRTLRCRFRHFVARYVVRLIALY